MLSLDVVEALTQCTIKDKKLYLPMSLNDEEESRFAGAIRDAMLARAVPMWKPIALRVDVNGPGFNRVQDAHDACDSSYISMLERLDDVIIVPRDDDYESINKDWKPLEGKRDGRFLRDIRGLNHISLSSDEMKYVRSVEDGPITLDRCIYQYDANKIKDMQKDVRYCRTLYTDMEPICTLSDNSSGLPFIYFVFANAAGETTARDANINIGHTGKNYMIVRQLFTLEHNIMVKMSWESNAAVEFTYKRKVNEEALTDLFRQFAVKMLKPLPSGRIPAYDFIEGYMTTMWRD